MADGFFSPRLLLLSVVWYAEFLLGKMMNDVVEDFVAAEMGKDSAQKKSKNEKQRRSQNVAVAGITCSR